MNRSRTGGKELDALDRRERQRVQIDTGSTGKGRTGHAVPVDEDKGIAGADTIEIEEGVLRGAVDKAWTSPLSPTGGVNIARRSGVTIARRLTLICHSGSRSALVSRFLDAQLGYRHVHDVPGGIERWMAEARPTVAPR